MGFTHFLWHIAAKVFARQLPSLLAIHSFALKIHICFMYICTTCVLAEWNMHGTVVAFVKENTRRRHDEQTTEERCWLFFFFLSFECLHYIARFMLSGLIRRATVERNNRIGFSCGVSRSPFTLFASKAAIVTQVAHKIRIGYCPRVCNKNKWNKT